MTDYTQIQVSEYDAILRQAVLQNLADDLKKESTEILICTPVEEKKAKGKSSVRKKIRPDAIEAGNAEQSLKDKQEIFKGVHHKGSDYLRPHPTPLHFAISPQDVMDFHTKGKCRGIKAYLCDEENPGQPVVAKKDGTLAERFNFIFDIDRIYAEHEDEVEELLWPNRIYTKGIVNATNKQFAKLDIDGFDFDRYILGTYAKKDEVLKRPLTAMKQDVREQLVKVE